METQYQRAKIQEESLYYETRKFTGELPIIGVNTFLNPNREGNSLEVKELIRSTAEDKNMQISRLREFQTKNKEECKEALENLKQVAISYGNIFDELLNTVNYASLGQISSTLYKIGGEYRRNI